jgi:hypothetical protein
MTTVGFGDITPQTNLGRLIASVMMLAGWGTLADADRHHDGRDVLGSGAAHSSCRRGAPRCTA